MTIVRPETPEQWEQVRELFREYWASFDLSPCFQNFGAELGGLPGDYAPPRGTLGLALVNGEAAGCAALRPFDERRAEFKRLFVRPAFRGHGAGRALMEWVIAEARRLGYVEIVADTLPQMSDALAMYDRHGFERTGPYAEVPTPEAIYLRFTL